MGRGDRFCYTSQILGEFWNVSTRPGAARGGFGLSVVETDRRLRLIERRYLLLEDTPGVHVEWRRLLVAYAVMGVQVHDARIVAAMNVHGVSHLLTFNVADFGRFSGITALRPQDV
jgi:predicted nucleic acid-binding protein